MAFDQLRQRWREGVGAVPPGGAHEHHRRDLDAWDKFASSGQASQDGILEPEDVAQMVVDTIRNENFLLLPHEQVGTYMQRKAADPDRWISGMQRFHARLDAARG